MKLYVPFYYSQFRCIAERCRHSCCIGWEIDIDDETQAYYQTVPGAFGKRLNQAIDDSASPAHFRLLEGDRCPLLNPNGLCDLICHLGEQHLCQICADHPRFRHFFTGRTEMGLGLCCEEAARIALSQTEKAHLLLLEEDGEAAPLSPEEEEVLALRQKLLTLLQCREMPFPKRLDALLEAVSFSLPEGDWKAFYRSLERLYPAWDDALNTLPTSLPPCTCPAHLALPMEQFAAYLLFRHLPKALEDGDVQGWTAFCVLSARMVLALCAAKPHCTFADLCELVRMYSAEIEYSDENMDALLDALWAFPEAP